MPRALAAAMPSTPNGPARASPAAAVTSRPAPIAPSGYQVGRPAEKYGRQSAPTSVWPSRPSAYTRITPAVAAVSAASKAPRWKRTSTICGAYPMTRAVPSSTTVPARARSRSTLRRAPSRSPDAMARATTGKVTVQIIIDSTMGNCATFCAKFRWEIAPSDSEEARNRSTKTCD